MRDLEKHAGQRNCWCFCLQRSPEHSSRSDLASVVLRKREDLSRALFEAVRDPSVATWKQNLRYEDVQEWGQTQLYSTVEIFRQWLVTSNELFLEMFAGWIQGQTTLSLSEEETPTDFQPHKAIEIVQTTWSELLGNEVGALANRLLLDDLGWAAGRFSRKKLESFDVLFIGDCLQFEIAGTLMGSCAFAGIEIKSLFLNEKVQAILRNRLRSLDAARYKLIFFSPFSHRYLSEYASLLEPNWKLASNTTIQANIQEMLKDVSTTLDTLVNHFDCPVYLHNTAGTVQSFGLFSGVLKNLITWRRRKVVRRIVNDSISSRIHEARLGEGSHVQLIDENALRKKENAFSLGRVYFNFQNFHPTRLGVYLAQGPYFDAVYVNAILRNKKVVVCDLDNTLWDGVIGEGNVTHFVDRQETLKELKSRGILLSINSKNDPKNIRWDGAVLQASDFVAEQINWGSKVQNMENIRDSLNLKLKDFVFIDDRPDERERISKAFPDILVLDATDARSWQHIARWKDVLPHNPLDDRTQLYHERSQREKFVQQQSKQGLEDETAALKDLALSVVVRDAKTSDLSRVVELINRTNQFNLRGTRTSVRELRSKIDSSQAIVIAEASDKFGKMGIVAAMLVESHPDRMDIPMFVLSCRVFGFGIEYALINAVKQIAPDTEELRCDYKETPSNEPCRKFYPNCGMAWDGEHWVGNVNGLPEVSSWLSVITAFSRTLHRAKIRETTS